MSKLKRANRKDKGLAPVLLLLSSTLCLCLFAEAYAIFCSSKEYVDAESIMGKIKENVKNIPYCEMSMEYVDKDGTGSKFEFKLNRDNDVTYYHYTDENDEMIEIINKDGDSYDVYAPADGTYVMYDNIQDGITVDLWGSFEELSDYTVSSDYDKLEFKFSDNNEDVANCYVLEKHCTSDKYSDILEYLFVDKDTLLPVGKLVCGLSESGDYESSDLEVPNADEATAEQEVISRDIVRYTYLWHKDDSYETKIPESFMTEDEYQDYLVDKEVNK